MRRDHDRSFALRTAVLGIVMTLLASAAISQTFGRFTLLVADEDGQPLAGAKVSVTCDELASFQENTTANKKGRVVIAVTDATRVYNIAIGHEGYESVTVKLKPEIGKTTLRTYKLRTLEAVAAAAAASQAEVEAAAQGGKPTVQGLSPAEKIFNDGVVALRAEDLAGAKASFLEALEKNPELGPAHSALAGVYIQEQNYDAALASAERLLALEPENPRGFRLRYEVYKATGRAAEAKAALAQLSSLGGGETGALIYNEGVAALQAGDVAGARARFEEAIAAQPDLAPAIAILGAMDMDDGAFDAALAKADRALASAPDNRRALQIRFDALKALGREEEAASAFQALAAADPSATFESLYTQAIEAFNAGDASKAREMFEQALIVQPDHGKAHYHLALTCTNLGDNAKAKESFERFLALTPDDPDAQAARDMLSYLE